MALIRLAGIRDTAVGLACCYAGMVAGIQLALGVYPPEAMLAGFGHEFHHSLSRLNLAACAGMLTGSMAHRCLLRSAQPAAVWAPALTSIVAMLIMHPPGTDAVLLSGMPLAALYIALLMMPAALLAHALCALARRLAVVADRGESFDREKGRPS